MFKKVLLTILVVIVVVLAVGYWYLSSYLPNPPAAPDIQVEVTTERIERGNYLANHVSLCMDCHAVRNWEFFAAPPSLKPLVPVETDLVVIWDYQVKCMLKI
ncbi:MAG TPA: hypothetical protein DCE78_05480 [Bacteroidetes bacterium]|nr:hypothetical protein [Bacteroidota bacterium]